MASVDAACHCQAGLLLQPTNTSTIEQLDSIAIKKQMQMQMQR
jgi:hypothetical protein